MSLVLNIDDLTAPREGVRTSARVFVTLPLADSVTVAGRRYDVLRFRPVKAHDVRKLARKGESAADDFALVARLAAVPVDVIRALGEADAERAAKVVEAQFLRVLR